MSMEQIARDIREGSFPKKSEKTLREEATITMTVRRYRLWERVTAAWFLLFCGWGPLFKRCTVCGTRHSASDACDLS